MKQVLTFPLWMLPHCGCKFDRKEEKWSCSQRGLVEEADVTTTPGENSFPVAENLKAVEVLGFYSISNRFKKIYIQTIHRKGHYNPTEATFDCKDGPKGIVDAPNSENIVKTRALRRKLSPQELSWFCFCYCSKHVTKNDLGRKGFNSAYRLQTIIQESLGRNPRWELGYRSEARTLEKQNLLAFYPWLAQLVSLHSPDPSTGRWHCLKWAGPSPINQLATTNMSSRHARRPTWLNQFLSWALLFQDDSRMCWQKINK